MASLERETSLFAADGWLCANPRAAKPSSGRIESMRAENSLRMDRLLVIWHFLFLEEQFCNIPGWKRQHSVDQGGGFCQLGSAIDAAVIRRREVRVQCPLVG